MLHVGLTGGIGSGKSAVAGMFAERGAVVLDSDRIVGELLKKGNAGYRETVKAFGKKILGGNGSIVKKRLAAIVFNDKDARKKLEEILHPLVVSRRREILDKLRRGKMKDAVVISEAALIFEAGTRGEFDRVVLVTAPEEARIKRLAAKGWTEEKVRERMRAQLGDDKKARLADFVVDNGGARARTEKQVEKIYRALLRGE